MHESDPPDFLLAAQLKLLTGVPLKSQYNQHSSGRGALAPILCKLGGKLGACRSDYEQWRDSQRKIKPTATEHRSAA